MASTSVSSNTPQTVIAFPYTGDYRIDVLLPGDNIKWDPTVPAGTVRTVTFSFAQTPAYLKDDPKAAEYTAGFTPFTDAQKAATRQILAAVSERIMVNFSEVSESTAANTPTGQIRFANNTQTDSSGYALQPYNSSSVDGDVFLNVGSISDSTAPGTFAYDTILHELTHALGLNHPGNYNAGEPASTDPGNYLASSEDSTLVSVMSYTEQSQGLQRVDYGPYDLLALGYLYGLRPLNTGDNTYRYTDSVGQQLQTLIDNGGTDTLDLSAITTAMRIDLRPGKSSSLGRVSPDADAAQNDLQLAFNTLIENLIGSPQDDTIIDNAANNQVDGGSGNDTVVFTGTAAQYTMTYDRATQQLRVNDGVKDRDGADALIRVETLEFSDKTIPVATATHGTYADVPVELYQFFIVAFDAAPGVTYMDQLAEAYRAGLSVKRIVEIFTSKSQFTDVYATTLSHQALASKLTQTIVKDSASTATKTGAVTDIQGALDAGWSTADVVYQVFGNLAKKPLTDPTWGNTAQFFQNEIAVAKAYTEVMNQSTTDLPTLRHSLAATTAATIPTTDDAAIELALMGLVSVA